MDQVPYLNITNTIEKTYRQLAILALDQSVWATHWAGDFQI